MAEYDIYVLVLCLIVFTAMTALFSILIGNSIKMKLQLIRGGLADTEILRQQQSRAKHKAPSAAAFFDRFLSLLVCVLVIGAFALAVSVRVREGMPVTGGKVPKVVSSGSMADKYEKNTYLTEHQLDNQIQKFDLIFLSALPAEQELQLYDIVVYELDGNWIVHRIVEIQEPDDTHAERYFVMQGDANIYPDRSPVRYEQMRGIWRGECIPYVGSFVVFMHSPAGYLCVLLVVFVGLALPVLEKKINRVVAERLAVLEKDPASAAPAAPAKSSPASSQPPAAVPPDASRTPSRQSDGSKSGNGLLALAAILLALVRVPDSDNRR